MVLYYDEPLELVSGNGRHVLGSDGRTYLDFFGGLLATMVGHGVEEIVEAIRSQAGKLLHSSTLYLISQQVELAEKIASRSRIPDARVFFVNSGSEAVETAFLLTTTAAKSNQVLALRGSYHGRTFGTVATTGIRAWSATSLSPLQVSYVHSGYRYRSPFGSLPDEQFVDACVDELRTIIETTTSGRVACMIAEPIQGAGGFASPPDGFFRRTKSVLDEYGIPLVSDEVQSGWGRTGREFFSMHAHGVVPEVLTFAKGLANGMAIGGVVASAELMNTVEANSISTAGGNPLAMAAANATLDYILSNDLQSNADARGTELLQGLRSLSEAYPAIGDVRGEGLMIGVELVVPGEKTPNVAYTLRILEKARELGLLIGRGGLLGNVLRITPPMSVTRDECSTALALLKEAFDQTTP
ncbi:aminotransferase class III-fold pyridoxal phosphate-dependent enzyme [Microbacterium sp. QXD-8]|uniref:alanine--glyoxylate transaminase n=1 Tax=Microbacterium psychrotolerans TaxID=3068321 RepID=A0ABU0YW09_9MICO|nr:aminotransferase class III-fold pyridoxal phosphate-dependent enzyme [Microbacterium sp. QXD-8]MDQ7876515.1 aminotransferase class III-fold pyridoxal phosphate-dependent enzyme [Microbacterium sp. QXD-8]